MPMVRLRHVNTVRRKGRVYYYHRITKERLPDEPNARALRVLEINASLKQAEPAGDSMDALIVAYKASADFTALAPITRRDYSRHLDAIKAGMGPEPVRAIERKHVLEARDLWSASTSPRQTNYRVTVLARLMAFAVDRGWRESNPALKVKRQKEGPGYQAWPLEAVRKALEASYPELRLAIAFMLLTALRPSDAGRAAWSNVGPRELTIRQGKTGAPVTVPIGYALRQLLAEAPKTAATILATKSGRAWQQNWLSREVAAVAAKVGHPGLTPHGLRETTATLLAEGGEGDAAIQAMLGHASPSQAAHYRRHADRTRLAKVAVARLDKAAREAGFANPNGQNCKTAGKRTRNAK